jgi:hypothetical protein
LDQEVQLPVGKACLELVEIELEAIEKEDASYAEASEVLERNRLGNEARLWEKVSQQHHEQNARNKGVDAGSGTDALESADGVSHKAAWLGGR